eukprot:7002201-Prorocentrum_lima.AAC.2
MPPSSGPWSSSSSDSSDSLSPPTRSGTSSSASGSAPPSVSASGRALSPSGGFGRSATGALVRAGKVASTAVAPNSSRASTGDGASSSPGMDWYSGRNGNTPSRNTTWEVVISFPLRGPSRTSSRYPGLLGELPRWMHLSARCSSLPARSASGRRAYARQNMGRKWLTVGD